MVSGSAEGAGSMADAEQREQSKWARKFIEMVRGKSFPAVVAAETTDNPERALADLLGSSRSGTVRLRMRTWLAMSRWMLVAKGRAWPSCSADIVDYINARRDEDRKTSFPKQLASAVRWVASRVGLDESAKWSGDTCCREMFGGGRAGCRDQEGPPLSSVACRWLGARRA